MKSHNKKCIIYFITGAMIFGTVGAFAGQYIATENTFPVQLNGKDVAVDGYNIDGSTLQMSSAVLMWRFPIIPYNYPKMDMSILNQTIHI